MNDVPCEEAIVATEEYGVGCTQSVEVLTLPDTVTLPVTCHKIGPVGQLLDSYYHNYVCINWPYIVAHLPIISPLGSNGFGLNICGK